MFRSSIVNLQFPDKSGFTLRYNPASGISATLRPAKLDRVRVMSVLIPLCGKQIQIISGGENAFYGVL